jgi:hypothetical protein
VRASERRAGIHNHRWSALLGGWSGQFDPTVKLVVIGPGFRRDDGERYLAGTGIHPYPPYLALISGVHRNRLAGVG